MGTRIGGMDTWSQREVVEALYIRHHGSLRRFLGRLLRCEETAAEVAHDVYLRLLRLAPGEPIGNPRAYLFRVARNAACDRMARDRTRDGVIDRAPPSDSVPCPEPDAEAAAAARERLRILSQAVADLPPRCRAVFLMSRLDGLSNGAIAARLGISRNMVEKHIIRAMMHCRRRLDAAVREVHFPCQESAPSGSLRE